MRTTEAIQTHIIDSDPNCDGAGAYTPAQITPEFARQRLEQGCWSDGTDIDEMQAEILQAVADGRSEIEL